MSQTLIISVLYLAGGAFIFLLGLTILRTVTSSAPTRATALILFFAGVGPILTGASMILQGDRGPGEYRSMLISFEYIWEFYFPSLLLFSLSYPRERRFFFGPFLLGLLVFSPYIFHLVTIIASDDLGAVVGDVSKHVVWTRQFSIAGKTVSFAGVANVVSLVLGTLIKLHRQLFLFVNILYASGALVLLFRSKKVHINPRLAGQLRTLSAGLAVSIAGYTVAKLLRFVNVFGGSESVNLALVNISLVTGGGSVAYAVIRQRFLGIRYVARRSILYAAASFIFAAVYLLVVKPVSDFFGQYSLAGKEAFETGAIIMTIIAFQPVLLRIEEMLEQVLLEGKDDLQARFRELGSEISNVATEEELESRLRDGFRRILDAADTRLHLDGGEARVRRLMSVLEKVKEPLTRHELIELGESGRLTGEPPPRRGRMGRRKNGSKEGAHLAKVLAGGDEVFVPILKEQRCVGMVTLGERTYGLKYNTDELALLYAISNQIGVAIDNIRLLRENVEKKVLEEELEIARRIQSQLLPAGPPKLDGFDLCAATIPSRHVGGDYYDFDVLDDATLVLVIADVAGKGIPASLLMATLRAAVNSNEDARRKPALMMQRMNTLLYHSTSAEEFATVFYGVVDLESGTITYANAGHEFPYLHTGGSLDCLEGSGIVLGCVLDYVYEEKTHVLPSGGALVMFTDGVTDAVAAEGENFGAERLSETVCANCNNDAAGLCAAILSAVRSFAQGGEYFDDLTLVVLKRNDATSRDTSHEDSGHRPR